MYRKRLAAVAVVLAVVLALVLAAVSTQARAQDWPTRPMTLIVPFAAGGGVDVSARIQAQGMSERLGQPIVVDNTIWAVQPA